MQPQTWMQFDLRHVAQDHSGSVIDVVTEQGRRLRIPILAYALDREADEAEVVSKIEENVRTLPQEVADSLVWVGFRSTDRQTFAIAALPDPVKEIKLKGA